MAAPPVDSGDLHALILFIQTLALCKSFIYLLNYLLKVLSSAPVLVSHSVVDSGDLLAN